MKGRDKEGIEERKRNRIVGIFRLDCVFRWCVEVLASGEL